MPSSLWQAVRRVFTVWRGPWVGAAPVGQTDAQRRLQEAAVAVVANLEQPGSRPGQKVFSLAHERLFSWTSERWVPVVSEEDRRAAQHKADERRRVDFGRGSPDRPMPLLPMQPSLGPQDIYVRTAAFARTRLVDLPIGVELRCSIRGWRLYANGTPMEHPGVTRVEGAPFPPLWMVVDIGGLVICDTRPWAALHDA